LAKLLAKKLNAVYLRIDTIEQALRDLCDINVQGEGYRLSYRVAADNLGCGNSVIADSCNPIELTRNEWEQVASDAGADYINIAIECSDKQEHRQRVENRKSEVNRLSLPDWNSVQNRKYHAWTRPRITIDTAGKSIEVSIGELIDELRIQNILIP
jgi:predicted kinase